MASRDDSAQILARFPGPVTLYPSRKKWLLVAAGGALFAVGGFLMIKDGKWTGWLVLLFFALVALGGIAAMLPGMGALRLDREGFEVTSLYRRHRYRWQDALHFQAAQIPPSFQQFVVYDDITQSDKRLAKVNVAITGRNAALPDTYGISPADLAGLMTEWRRRALA